MNILVANISALQSQPQQRTYHLYFKGAICDSIVAYQTNESIAKAFGALDEIANSGGIHKVVALVSQKVRDVRVEWANNLTALEYYNQVIHSLWTQAELVSIDVDNKEPEEMLRELMLHFSPHDNVYIDAAGGRRTDANVIQQTVKILQYVDIKVAMSLYADIQQSPESSYIRETSEFLDLENISAALSEFMSTGRADALYDIPDANFAAEWKRLFEAMREFSDSISIGNVDNIDQTLINIQQAIAVCENIEADDVHFVIIKRFLPIFKEKIIGESTTVDYLRIIQWCVGNKMVQQALTIIVEKLPKYLIDYEYFFPRNATEKCRIQDAASKDTMFHGNWEAYALYKELLGITANVDASVEELKQVLTNKKLPNKSNQDVETAWKTVQGFNNNRLTYNGSLFSRGVTEIRNAIKYNGYKTFDSLCNSIANQEPLLLALLGKKKEKKKDTISVKLTAIDQIQQNGASDQFKYNEHLDWHWFTKVLYSYVYVKAIRNQINHASSEENLTQEDKEILRKQGLDCSTYSLSTICNNLQFLIDAVKKAKQPIVVAEKTALNEFKGNKGDTVEATCVSAGIVRIEGLNYNIPMVVDRAVDKNGLIGKKVKVVVEQFRKNSKVVSSVRYINPNPPMDVSNLLSNL